MRTLKKTLALVLVVAMMMSLCITSNAAFTDADEIEYSEAVSVMTAIGVIDGFPAGDFQPQGSLTRAQAAKILVYMLGAEDIAKADGQIFDDVKEGHWAADYIAYCAEEGLVNGYGDGNFGPEDKLTAYQWAKMLLAALGVDTSAMIGAAWQIPVAKAAAKYDIFADNLESDKTQICTREEACLYALNALKYGEARGYAVYNGEGYAVAFYPTVTEASHAALALGDEYTISTRPVAYSDTSLLKVIHGINFVDYADAWGRPGVLYYNNKYTVYMPFIDEYEAVFYTAVSECDIATAVGLRNDTAYDLYTNGAWTDYVVQPTDTVQKIGAQGTLVEVYEDEIVVIDTFLAMVTDVTPITYDKAGHQKSDATITLAVFTSAANDISKATVQTVKDYNPYFNYSYTEGDMVLVNAYTMNTEDAKGNVTVGAIATGRNNYAYYIDILGLAETMVGAQTFLWYNAAQHTIDGVNYDDAKWFKLDEAGTSTSDHTWYFDQYDNLIGATDIATVYAYGIIEDIQWINPVGASGYAQATIRYMDGTTETKAVDSIDGLPTVYADWYGTGEAQTKAVAVSTNIDDNTELCGNHLYRIATSPFGTISLEHVFYTEEIANTVTEYTAELTAATIKTGISAIQGTAATAGGKTVIYGNTDTVYLIQTKTPAGDVYTVVTGYQNMAAYTGTATVDYVNLDSDIYAEYVYVTGRLDSATSSNLFYLTSDNAQAVLKFGAVDHYVVSGYLDGVYRTDIEVKPSVINALIPSVNTTSTVSYVNEMFGVSIVDGEIVGAWLKNGTHNLGTEIGKAYTNKAMVKYTPATGSSALYNGEVLALSSGLKLNVVGLVPVVGELSANMSNKEIYVIYDTSVVVADAYKAVAIYVADLGDKDEGSAINPVLPDTMALALNGDKVEATYKNNSAYAESVTVVYSYRVSGSGSGYATYESAAYTVASGATEVWSIDTLSLPTSTVPQMYEVVATAYDAYGNVLAQASANFLK